MNQTLKREIGPRIAEQRLRQHMTQEQLAVKLDSTVKHVSEVERGTQCFSLEKLLIISEVLDCDLDYLLKGERPKDYAAYLPGSVKEILNSGDTDQINLFTEYASMFTKILQAKH